jgi:HlyD family secretion protein
MRARWVVLLLLIGGGAAAAWWLTRDREGGAPPAWKTAVVERGAVVETVNTTGTVQALKTVTIGTQVSGVIKEMLVDYDSRVTKGQVIARLEPDVLQARLAQESALLAAAEAAVERSQIAIEEAEARERRIARLVQQSLAKQEDLETAGFAVRTAKATLRADETRVLQARASVGLAKTNLDYATITSPIDGVVLTKVVDVGQTVAAGLQAPTLFTIAEDLRQMRVEASVDEADIGRVHTGQRVSFSVDAFPDRRFKGRVTQRRLGPVVTNNVVTYQVIVDTENPDLTLLPGMTANVSIVTNRVEEALVVPAAALRFAPPDAQGSKPGRGEGPPGPDGRGQTAGAAREGGAGSAGGDRGGGPRGEGRRKNRIYLLEGAALKEVEVEVGPSDGLRVAVSPVEGATLAEGAVVVTGQESKGGAPGGQPVNPMRLMRGGR